MVACGKIIPRYNPCTFCAIQVLCHRKYVLSYVVFFHTLYQRYINNSKHMLGTCYVPSQAQTLPLTEVYGILMITTRNRYYYFHFLVGKQQLREVK